MKKTTKILLAGLLAVPMLALGVSLATPVPQSTFALTMQEGAEAAKSDEQAASLDGETGVFKTITNVALYVIGAISVLMLIYGGIRYTISGGDTAAVTAAKNTILYAIVGIVVALLAFAVVNFVLTNLIS